MKPDYWTESESTDGERSTSRHTFATCTTCDIIFPVSLDPDGNMRPFTPRSCEHDTYELISDDVDAESG